MAFDFNKFAAKGNEFIKGLAKEFGHPEDTDRTSRKLRAILHAIRDRLTMEESLQLLAQLPMFLKAIYVENWQTAKQKRIRHMDEFIREVRKYDTLSYSDFEDDDDVENATVVLFMELRQFISLGELEDIKAVLPKELKPLTNNVLMF